MVSVQLGCEEYAICARNESRNRKVFVKSLMISFRTRISPKLILWSPSFGVCYCVKTIGFQFYLTHITSDY